MAAAVHLFGAEMGAIETSAERDSLGHIRLQIRINATCESASAVMSEAEAQAAIAALSKALTPRAEVVR